MSYLVQRIADLAKQTFATVFAPQVTAKELAHRLELWDQLHVITTARYRMSGMGDSHIAQAFEAHALFAAAWATESWMTELAASTAGRSEWAAGHHRLDESQRGLRLREDLCALGDVLAKRGIDLLELSGRVSDGTPVFVDLFPVGTINGSALIHLNEAIALARLADPNDGLWWHGLLYTSFNASTADRSATEMKPALQSGPPELRIPVDGWARREPMPVEQAAARRRTL